ncbi:serine/threonine-protein kinase [Streptomyces longwoodensis]|uniref:serine/threonine-protein kinase n=1 Tax=Streptomyces longwoodensis TaxID=68231 RepID=UPI0037F2F2D7
MRPLEPGDPLAVGGYPLLARLGAGGMGQVYLSRTPAGRALALKTIRPDLAAHPDFGPRFAREIRTSDRVRTPWTASVVDFSPPGGHPQWLAVEYVTAPSLADRVTAHGPLPPAAVRALAAELAAALAAVHACDLAHRDVKPSNVLLARERPVLIDFGIARAADESRHTRTGGVVGSPGYLAPEQASHGAAGPSGDLFSLGAVLAYAATGRGPFEHPGEQVSAASLLYRIVHEEPRLDGVPEDLLPVVRRCLAKDPGQRPTTTELTALWPRAGRGTGAGWEESLPPGLTADLDARAAEVTRLCAPPSPPVHAVPPSPPAHAVPPLPPTHTAPPFATSQAPSGTWPPTPAPPAGPPPARRSRGALLWSAAGVVTAVAVATVLWVNLLGPDDGDEARNDDVTSAPASGSTPGSASAALSTAWAGTWTGEGTGNPDADGRLQPRTSSFRVTLTLHTAARGELAGKQVSHVSEVGTGREVGCTEALEVREVHGSTATFEAVTSHPTDRSAPGLSCPKGNVYVVRLTGDGTMTLGEEGAQAAGAPSALRRVPTS